MKRFFISTMALAAVLFVSCEKEGSTNGGNNDDPSGKVEDVKVYLTTGTSVADEVNYAISYSEITGKEDVVGSNVISLKLAAQKAVSSAVKGSVKADLTKVPEGFTAMPEGAFTFDNASTEIAAGAKEGAAAFVITLDASKMPEAGQYALPVVLEISGGHAVLSTKSSTVMVKFTRTIEKAPVEDEWKKIAKDRFTANSLADYEGFVYTGLEVDKAFDEDLTTGWYSTCYDYNSYAYADDKSAEKGCFAEVVFNEPVQLRGVVVSGNPEGTYYRYRARRLSIMFKYEGDADYTWDKTYDEEKDELYYTCCPMLAADAPGIPGYQASPADFLITEANYSTFRIDLTEKLAGRKVAAMIIAPAMLYGGRQYLFDDSGNYVTDDDGNYQFVFDEEKQDYVYEYYYDMYYGTNVDEITLYE